jgi:hypothetical protein
MPPHAKPKKERRIKPGSSPTYLDLIRQLPCILSGRPAEAAHIRYADAKHGKADTGAARKPDDKWCLPLAPELHRMHKGCQHDAGDERAWWAQFGIDPLEVCSRLWGKSRIQMERVIIMTQPWDQAVKDKVLAILKNGKA